MDEYDLLVIGGGINGCGIARDAAGRGLRVALCEQGDLGGATSWASSKLVHGGLRYLESGQLRLVREALAERAILLRAAPHLVRPLRLVLPHTPGMRPAWMIRLGLWLYDRLGGRRHLPASAAVPITSDLGLAARCARGFEYSDAQVDDARLVVANALDAAHRGARIFVRARATEIAVSAGQWQVCIEQDGRPRLLRTRVLVNAAGPWAQRVLAQAGGDVSRGRLRLVRGSHLVVARKPPARALLLQNDDGRVVFVLPMEADFTLVGTTDVEVSDAGDASMSPAERDYLLAAVNRYLEEPICAREIVWSYAGVRALYDDGTAHASAISRDYVLRLDRVAGLPCLSVLGGKLTTYRRLAEHALARLAPWLPMHKGPWTACAPLAGGELPQGIEALRLRLLEERPGLPADVLSGMVARHGSLVRCVLGDAHTREQLGRDFGAGLCQREVDYFVRCEWARSADDVLWRRSKCGLRMNPAQRAALCEYVDGIAGEAAATTEDFE